MSKYSLISLGSFFLLISFLLFLNIIYSYYFNFYLNINGYLPSMIVSLLIGINLIIFRKKYIYNSIYWKIFIVLIGYIFLPIVIALPYYFSIYNISILDSYFEAVSGFTSTGFTIFESVKYLDPSIIIWRSTSQWVGGLYFLFSIIYLIDIFDENLKKSLTNFISFDSSEFLKQAFKILSIYIFLTFLIFIFLKLINFRNFDAYNFSLTIISSGGFKPIDYLNPLLDNDIKILIFSFTLLFSFFSIFLIYNLVFLKKRNLNFFTEDFYLLAFLISIIFLFFIFSGSENFTSFVFATTSSVSNIGIYFSKFDNNYSLVFLILVIIGGSFFSTSSGLRFFKIYTLLKFSFNELLSHTKPRQVMINKVIFENKNINYKVINKYFLSIIIFILSLTTISSLLTIQGLELEQSFKLGILTIMNTVNSSIYGLEELNFQDFSKYIKIVLILFMIIGRIELVTMLIIIKKFLFKN